MAPPPDASPVSIPSARRDASRQSTKESTPASGHAALSGPSSRSSTPSQWLQKMLTRRSSRQSTQPLRADVEPAYWGISQDDLKFFKQEVWKLWAEGAIPDNPAVPNPFHDDEQIGPSIYQVNSLYIKPTTLNAGGMSWALMRNPTGLKCDTYASHAWAEGVFEFIWKVLANWPRQANGLYCCFLANPQNGDIGSLLGRDPSHSPFARALEVCSHVLIVPNRRVSVYSRLWCVYEADLAMQHGLQITMPTRPKPRSVFVRMLPYLIAAGFLCVLFVYLEVNGLILPRRPWTPCNLQRLLVLLFAPFSHRLRKLYISSLCFAVGWQAAHWLAHDDECFYMLVDPNTLARGMMVLEDNLDSLFITLTSVEILVTELVAEALEDEGKQLESDSVQNASCSNAEDSRAIRKIIYGREDAIDRMITLLKQVGRYDDMVALNLKRGMRPARVKDGVMHMRGVAGCTHWVEGTVRTIAASVNGPVAMTVLEAGIGVNIFCSVVMFCFTSWWGAGATYFVDVLLFSSLVDHFVNEFLWYVVFKQRLYSVYTSENSPLQGLAYASVLASLGAMAFTKCVWFYRRRPKSQSPGLSQEERRESSSDSGETSSEPSEEDLAEP